MRSVVELVALLSGQAPQARDLLSSLGLAESDSPDRTCVDAGAGFVFAVRAPGPRSFDVQVRATGGQAHEVQVWHGVRTAGDVRAWTRSVWPAKAARAEPPEGFGRAGRVLSANGRIWSVESDPRGSTVSWQIDRHLPFAEVLDLAGLGHAWAPAAPALDLLHGFAVSTTSGPWSVALRREEGRLCPIRIGTTRWAWTVEDEPKRQRLAAWIARFGGDGGFASALYDLVLATRALAPGSHSVGRAAEVDVSEGEVVAVSAYVVSEGSQPWHG